VGTSLTEATVTVGSQGVSNSTTITLSSAFTPGVTYPAGTPVSLPDDGYLAIQIDGVSGSAPGDVSQISVEITSPSGSSSTFIPDSTGCVYEQEPPTATGTYYTISPSSSSTPPNIDPTENTAPQAQVTVSAGSTTVEDLNFDQADSVTFSASGSVLWRKERLSRSETRAFWAAFPIRR